MKILHRYILREMASPAILGLILFTFALLVRDLFHIIDLVMNQGVALRDIVELLACLLPTVLILTIPMAALVATLLCFGRLSVDHEIMAIRTSGINLLSLFTPPIILAAILSVLMALANIQLIPYLHLRLTDLKYQLIFKAVAALSPGRSYDNFASAGHHMTFRFEQRDQDGTLHNIVIKSKYTSPASQSSSRAVAQPSSNIIIAARTAEISSDLPHRAIHINLHDGTIQITHTPQAPNLLSPQIHVIHFNEMEKVIFPDLKNTKQGRYRKPPSEMTLNELSQAIKASDNPLTRNQLRIERLRRIAFPFSTLAFVLIAIPFGIVTKVAGRGVAVLTASLLILAYYALSEWAQAVGLTGSPLTPLAIWAPNIILAAVGAIMSWWVVRQ